MSETNPAGKFSRLLAVLAIALPIGLYAQEIAPPPTSVAEEEEIVELSPFVIDAEEDSGSYAATASLAGTRLRTNVKDVASAIQVVTKQGRTVAIRGGQGFDRPGIYTIRWSPGKLATGFYYLRIRTQRGHEEEIRFFAS